MADFSNQKKSSTAVYPVHAKEWKGDIPAFEPLMDVKTFRRRYLKGIPHAGTYTDADIKDFLSVAVNEAELELSTPILTRIYEDRLPFEREGYRSFIHLVTRVRPLKSVLDLSIVSSDERQIFQIPAEWIDNGQYHRGQLNVVPYLAAYTSNTVSGWQASIGSMFLLAIAGVKWMPGYWTVKYEAGLQCEDGTIPVIANKLIGIMAAIDVLGNLGTLNQYSSTSVNQDNIGQSTGGPGPALYAQRLQELEGQKENLIKKIKGRFGNKIRMTSF